MRKGSQGNESTVLQESVLDPYNYAANSSFTAYTAFLDGKDFSSECSYIILSHSRILSRFTDR